jgi:peptidoglycan/xylan/chitin deacetylase (PgdA/CDA1 family)
MHMVGSKEAGATRRHVLGGVGAMALLGGCARTGTGSVPEAALAGSPASQAEPASMARSGKVVYLTFDDGPAPGFTEKILDHLKVGGVRATFFLIGKNMVGNQTLIRRMISEGHVLGTHSWSHPDFSELAPEQAHPEIERPITWLRTNVGYESTLFRYPYGNSSRAGDAALWQLAQRPHWWHIGPADWDPKVTDASIIEAVMRAVAPGSVIDLHDRAEGMPPRSAPTFLPGLLAQLKAASYAFGVLDSAKPYPGTLH